MTYTRRTLLLLLSTGVLVAACSDAPTNPSAGSPLGQVSVFDGQALFSSATLSPTSSSQSETASLGSYLYSTLSIITVAGTEEIRRSAAWGSTAGQLLGVFDAGGVFDGWSESGDCSANVRYGFTQQGGRNICWYDNPNRPPPQTYTDTMQVRGTGTATWKAGPNFRLTFCGGTGPACWDISGGFSIDVTRIPAQLTLSASATSVAPGTAVSFVAGRTPSVVGSRSVPFQVLQWRWVPDSGGPLVVLCGVQTTCNYTPQVSGVMTVDGVANGEQQTVSKRIRVNPCPPVNDSTLNDPDFRQILLDQLAESRRTWPYKERVGYTFLMPDGRIIYQDASSNPTDCNVDRVPPSYPPGGVIDDLVHTHPVRTGERYVTCAKVPPGTKKTVDQQPSPQDMTMLTELLSFNPNGNLWVISGDMNVWHVDANGNVRRWKMGSKACVTP